LRQPPTLFPSQDEAPRHGVASQNPNTICHHEANQTALFADI